MIAERTERCGETGGSVSAEGMVEIGGEERDRGWEVEWRERSER
jgi:hypothetical protein